MGPSQAALHWLSASGENHGAEGPSLNVLGQQDVDTEFNVRSQPRSKTTATVPTDGLDVHVSIQTSLVYRPEFRTPQWSVLALRNTVFNKRLGLVRWLSG